MPPGAITTEISNDALDMDDMDDDETSTDDENASNSIHIFDKSELFSFIFAFLIIFLLLVQWVISQFFYLWSLIFFWLADSKYQSNLNEIDKFEHKSSLETSNKGFGWPTDNIGISFGKFSKFIFVDALGWKNNGHRIIY